MEKIHILRQQNEAATADLGDINMIDSFHLEKYNIKAVNYNRDISAFPILKNMLNKITGKNIYNSPTDMGVNMISKCIVNEEVAQNAARMEIIRRYYDSLCDFKKGIGNENTVETIKKIMNRAEISTSDRKIVKYALEKSEKTNSNIVAIMLENGKVITGKESELLSASSALLINAMKELAGIPDDVYLLSPPEVLIALSICEKTNPIIEKTFECIDKLRGLEAHSSYIVSTTELKVLKSIGINLTCEPKLLGYEG